MTDVKPPQSDPAAGGDALSHLHKMSTTAGLGTTEYVAVNGLSVVAVIMGLASSLSLLDYVLLAIPAVAIVLSLMALHQIRNSNGTQTGKGLAILGLVLALLFVAVVGGRWAMETLKTANDKRAINDLIEQFDQTVRAKKYDQAYGMFTSKFTSRVKQQNFTDLWKKLVEGTPEYSGLTDIQSNNRMEFETNADSGQKFAVAMTIMDFGPKVPPQRFEMIFTQNPDGTWKLSDIPKLFPPEQQQGPPKR